VFDGASAASIDSRVADAGWRMAEDGWPMSQIAPIRHPSSVMRHPASAIPYAVVWTRAGPLATGPCGRPPHPPRLWRRRALGKMPEKDGCPRDSLGARDMGTDKVNLRDKFARFDDQWSPKIVGELNGQLVKLVKFQGEFVWHHHDHEDELFLVVKGRFRMEFRDRHVWLGEGEFLIVPRGVEHRPVAEDEVHVLLFEPATTLNTGNVTDGPTV